MLACVGRETACRPLDVYRFFKEIGIAFIQFTPIVERLPDTTAQRQRLWPVAAGLADRPDPNGAVTPWRVEPERYGDFLIAIYEEWVRNDVGDVFVMNFEWALNAWIGDGSPVCVFARQCGRALAIEHDGSVYACDHYVYPEYRLGNVKTDDLGGWSSRRSLPVSDRTRRRRSRGAAANATSWRCAGAAARTPLRHVARTANRVCTTCAPATRSSSRHIRKYLHAMTQLLGEGLPVSLVMQAAKGQLVIKLTREMTRANNGTPEQQGDARSPTADG